MPNNVLLRSVQSVPDSRRASSSCELMTYNPSWMKCRLKCDSMQRRDPDTTSASSTTSAALRVAIITWYVISYAARLSSNPTLSRPFMVSPRLKSCNRLLRHWSWRQYFFYCQTGSFLHPVGVLTPKFRTTPSLSFPDYPLPRAAHRGCWMLLLQYFLEVWMPVITTPLRQTLEAYRGLIEPLRELDTPLLSNPRKHAVVRFVSRRVR